MGLTSKKILSVSLALIYATTQVALGAVAEANFWKERRTIRHSRESGNPVVPVKTFGDDVLLASLPPSLKTSPSSLINQLPAVGANSLISRTSIQPQPKKSAHLSPALRRLVESISFGHGSIQDVYDSKDPTTSPLLLIQDVHLNPEAQTNIAALLQELISQNQVGLVGVEGAFNEFDFAPFRPALGQPGKMDLVKTLLEQNKLGAPSFVGLTSPDHLPPFLGVDDVEYYEANVQAYLDSQEMKPAVQRQLTALEADVAKRKAASFSPGLKAFDDLYSAYQKGEVGLGHYLQNLSVPDSSLDFVLEQFIEAYQMEQKLDFTQVDKERRTVIEKLTQQLKEAEIQNLIADSLAYRMGRIGFGAYYSALKRLCESKAISLQDTPAFDNYIRYVLLSDGINADKLFGSIEKAERETLQSLAKTREEQEVVALSQRLGLINKLIEFSLTPGEWERYKSMVDRRPTTIDGRLNLSSFERFYEEADIRSEKMVKNLSLARPSIIDHRPSILVAGGFHTDEIKELLRKEKISYLVVSPKITKVDTDSGSAYLSVFAREKTPLEKLFTGHKLFVNPASLAVGSAAGFKEKELAKLPNVTRQMEMAVATEAIINPGKVTSRLQRKTLLTFNIFQPTHEKIKAALSRAKGAKKFFLGLFYILTHPLTAALTETAGFWAAVKFAASVDPTGASWITIGIIAFIFSVLHGDLIRKVRAEGWRAFFTREFWSMFVQRFGGGVAFTMLLALPFGFFISWGVHTVANVAISMGRARNWPLLKYLRLFSLGSSVMESGLPDLDEPDVHLVISPLNDLFDEDDSIKVINGIIRGKINDDPLPLDIISEGREVYADDLTAWVDGLTITDISESSHYDNFGRHYRVVNGVDQRGRHVTVLFVFDNENRLVSAGINLIEKEVLSATFGGQAYYQLPRRLHSLMATRMNSITRGKPVNRKAIHASPPWVESKQDEKIFNDTLDTHPLIRKFIERWINKGVKPKIKGRWRIFRFPIQGGAHYNPSRNLISRVTRGTGEISTFVHEFIHAVFEKLTPEQQKAIEKYFKSKHPQFAQMFEYFNGGLYAHSSHNFATEAVAYFLEALFSGNNKLRFKAKPATATIWHGDKNLQVPQKGFDFTVVLDQQDIDFLHEIGIIDDELHAELTKNPPSGTDYHDVSASTQKFYEVPVREAVLTESPVQNKITSPEATLEIAPPSTIKPVELKPLPVIELSEAPSPETPTQTSAWSKIKTWFSRPFIKAPSWEWIYQVPTILALSLGFSLPLVMAIALAMSAGFARNHRDASPTQKIILFALSLLFTQAFLTPALFMNDAVWAGFAGLAFNIFIHSFYNSVVMFLRSSPSKILRKLGEYLPLASIPTSDGGSEQNGGNKSVVEKIDAWIASLKGFDPRTDRRQMTGISLQHFLNLEMPLLMFDPLDPDHGNTVRNFIEKINMDQLRPELIRLFEIYLKYTGLLAEVNRRVDERGLSSEGKITHLIFRQEGPYGTPMRYVTSKYNPHKNVIGLNIDYLMDPENDIFGIESIAHEAGHGWVDRFLDRKGLPNHLKEDDEIYANWAAAHILSRDEIRKFIEAQVRVRLRNARSAKHDAASPHAIAYLAAFARVHGISESILKPLGPLDEILAIDYRDLYVDLSETQSLYAAKGVPLRTGTKAPVPLQNLVNIVLAAISGGTHSSVPDLLLESLPFEYFIDQLQDARTRAAVGFAVHELLKNAIQAVGPSVTMATADAIREILRQLEVTAGSENGFFVIAFQNRGNLSPAQFPKEKMVRLRAYLAHLGYLYRVGDGRQSLPDVTLASLDLSAKAREYARQTQPYIAEAINLLDQKIKKIDDGGYLDMEDVRELVFGTLITSDVEGFKLKYFEWPGKTNEKRNVSLGGFGKGLALAKRRLLAEYARGTIGFENVNGDTRFFLKIPLLGQNSSPDQKPAPAVESLTSDTDSQTVSHQIPPNSIASYFTDNRAIQFLGMGTEVTALLSSMIWGAPWLAYTAIVIVFLLHFIGWLYARSKGRAPPLINAVITHGLMFGLYALIYSLSSSNWSFAIPLLVQIVGDIVLMGRSRGAENIGKGSAEGVPLPESPMTIHREASFLPLNGNSLLGNSQEQFARVIIIEDGIKFIFYVPKQAMDKTDDKDVKARALVYLQIYRDAIIKLRRVGADVPPNTEFNMVFAKTKNDFPFSSSNSKNDRHFVFIHTVDFSGKVSRNEAVTLFHEIGHNFFKFLIGDSFRDPRIIAIEEGWAEFMADQLDTPMDKLNARGELIGTHKFRISPESQENMTGLMQLDVEQSLGGKMSHRPDLPSQYWGATHHFFGLEFIGAFIDCFGMKRLIEFLKRLALLKNISTDDYGSEFVRKILASMFGARAVKKFEARLHLRLKKNLFSTTHGFSIDPDAATTTDVLGYEASGSPINLKNASRAFFIVSAISAALIGFSFLGDAYMSDTAVAAVRSIAIALLLFFGALWGLIPLSYLMGRFAGMLKATGPPARPRLLDRDVMKGDSQVGFIRFDSKAKQFNVHPRLYALLSHPSFLIRFSTYAVLNLFLVPLHEYVHVLGIKNEFFAYGTQAVGVIIMASLFLYAPLWIPVLVAVVAIGPALPSAKSTLAQDRDLLLKSQWDELGDQHLMALERMLDYPQAANFTFEEWLRLAEKMGRRYYGKQAVFDRLINHIKTLILREPAHAKERLIQILQLQMSLRGDGIKVHSSFTEELISQIIKPDAPIDLPLIEDVAVALGVKEKNLPQSPASAQPEPAASHDPRDESVRMKYTNEDKIKMMEADHPHLYRLLFHEESLKKLMTYASFLRLLFEYQKFRDIRGNTPPLEYAIQNGIYFPLGNNLYITPITESFRRHIIFELKKGSDRVTLENIAAKVEIKIPGFLADKREVAPEGYTIAEKIWYAYRTDISEEPLALVELKEWPGMYGFAEFTNHTNPRVLIYEYENDASRLDSIPIRQMSIAQQRDIAEQCVQIVAKCHAIGLLGQYDLTIPNFRLIRRDGALKVILAGDFEDYVRTFHATQLSSELYRLIRLFMDRYDFREREAFAATLIDRYVETRQAINPNEAPTATVKGYDSFTDPRARRKPNPPTTGAESDRKPHTREEIFLKQTLPSLSQNEIDWLLYMRDILAVVLGAKPAYTNLDSGLSLLGRLTFPRFMKKLTRIYSEISGSDDLKYAVLERDGSGVFYSIRAVRRILFDHQNLLYTTGLTDRVVTDPTELTDEDVEKWVRRANFVTEEATWSADLILGLILGFPADDVIAFVGKYRKEVPASIMSMAAQTKPEVFHSHYFFGWASVTPDVQDLVNRMDEAVDKGIILISEYLKERTFAKKLGDVLSTQLSQWLYAPIRFLRYLRPVVYALVSVFFYSDIGRPRAAKRIRNDSAQDDNEPPALWQLRRGLAASASQGSPEAVRKLMEHVLGFDDSKLEPGKKVDFLVDVMHLFGRPESNFLPVVMEAARTAIKIHSENPALSKKDTREIFDDIHRLLRARGSIKTLGEVESFLEKLGTGSEGVTFDRTNPTNPKNIDGQKSSSPKPFDLNHNWMAFFVSAMVVGVAAALGLDQNSFWFMALGFSAVLLGLHLLTGYWVRSRPRGAESRFWKRMVKLYLGEHVYVQFFDTEEMHKPTYLEQTEIIKPKGFSLGGSRVTLHQGWVGESRNPIFNLLRLLILPVVLAHAGSRLRSVPTPFIYLLKPLHVFYVPLKLFGNILLVASKAIPGWKHALNFNFNVFYLPVTKIALRFLELGQFMAATPALIKILEHRLLQSDDAEIYYAQGHLREILRATRSRAAVDQVVDIISRALASKKVPVIDQGLSLMYTLASHHPSLISKELIDQMIGSRENLPRGYTNNFMIPFVSIIGTPKVPARVAEYAFNKWIDIVTDPNSQLWGERIEWLEARPDLLTVPMVERFIAARASNEGGAKIIVTKILVEISMSQKFDPAVASVAARYLAIAYEGLARDSVSVFRSVQKGLRQREAQTPSDLVTVVDMERIEDAFLNGTKAAQAEAAEALGRIAYIPDLLSHGLKLRAKDFLKGALTMEVGDARLLAAQQIANRYYHHSFYTSPLDIPQELIEPITDALLLEPSGIRFSNWIDYLGEFKSRQTPLPVMREIIRSGSLAHTYAKVVTRFIRTNPDLLEDLSATYKNIQNTEKKRHLFLQVFDFLVLNYDDAISRTINHFYPELATHEPWLTKYQRLIDNETMFILLESQASGLMEWLSSEKSLPALNGDLRDVITVIAGFGLNFKSYEHLGEFKRALALATREIRGNFDIGNPLHHAANFLQMRKEEEALGESRKLTIEEYKDMIQHPERLDMEAIPQDDHVQLRALAYEAYQMMRFINQLKQQAAQEGRRVVVVANKSYGRMAAGPIVGWLQQNGIPYLETKIASTDAHNHPDVIDFEDRQLFNDEQVRMFVRERPYVVVIDGSYSIDYEKIGQFKRQEPRFPDAYQGYRNFFIALNEGMNAERARQQIKEFQKDPAFLEVLRNNPKYAQLVAKVMDLGMPSSGALYKMRFWTPAFGSRRGILKFSENHKIRSDRSPPIFDFESDIGSPTLIMVQSTIESPNHPLADKQNPTIPIPIQQWINGENQSAYFDDKDHFRSYTYGFISNYGIVRSQVYAQTAQKYVNDLVENLGEKDQFSVPQIPIRDKRRLDGYVFDLSGTLARFGHNIPDWAKDKLNDLLRSGKKVAVVTDDREDQDIQGRLIDHIEPRLRQHLSVYLNGGRTLWLFDSEGNRIVEKDRPMASFEKQFIEGAIQRILREGGVPEVGYRFDSTSYNVSLDLSGFLKGHSDRDDTRRSLIGKIENELKQMSSNPHIYLLGQHHIVVTLGHKPEAVQDFMERNEIPQDRLLIAGNEAGSRRNDREMMKGFDDAVKVNVGPISKSLERRYVPNTYQIVTDDSSSLQATRSLLDAIDEEGNIDVGLLESRAYRLKPAAYKMAAIDPAEAFLALLATTATSLVVGLTSTFFFPGLTGQFILISVLSPVIMIVGVWILSAWPAQGTQTIEFSNLSHFLKLAEPDPAIPFVSVIETIDGTRFLKAHPAALARFSKIPVIFQNILLYSLGITGHEFFHLRFGMGEFKAYVLTQILPSWAGSFLFGIIAVLLGLSIDTAIISSVIGGFVSVGVTALSLRTQPKVNDIEAMANNIVDLALATKTLDDRRVTASSVVGNLLSIGPEHEVHVQDLVGQNNRVSFATIMSDPHLNETEFFEVLERVAAERIKRQRLPMDQVSELLQQLAILGLPKTSIDNIISAELETVKQVVLVVNGPQDRKKVDAVKKLIGQRRPLFIVSASEAIEQDGRLGLNLLNDYVKRRTRQGLERTLLILPEGMRIHADLPDDILRALVIATINDALQSRLIPGQMLENIGRVERIIARNA